MILVVLGIMLFNTTLISTYNILSDQTVIIYRRMCLMQGLEYTDRYFQKIDAENISEDFTFSEIHNTYKYGYNDSLNINDILYHINIRSNYCDDSGDTLNPHPDSIFQRVDIRVWFKSYVSDTLRVGTQTEPISKVFADMST